jgi:hypothetical protein
MILNRVNMPQLLNFRWYYERPIAPFRDLQTLRQNAIASWSRYESLGKLILGRQSDWAFHQL